MLFDWRLRGADGFDLPFLEQVFVIAADWNPATAKGAEHWMADPTLEKYLGSWRTGSDFGFVIDSDEGPIGAVWMRYFTAADAEDAEALGGEHELAERRLGARRGGRLCGGRGRRPAVDGRGTALGGAAHQENRRRGDDSDKRQCASSAHGFQ